MVAAALLLLAGAVAPATAPATAWGDALPGAAGVEPTCGTFAQSREVPGLKRPLASGGWFMVSAEHGLAWMQTRPFDSLLIIDDERVTQRVMDHPPVTMTEHEQPAVLSFNRALLDVFRGRMDALAEQYIVRIEGSGGHWQATLEPKDELLGRMIRYIGISGSSQYEEVIVQGATGDMLSIALSNVAPCDPEAGNADFGVFDIR